MTAETHTVGPFSGLGPLTAAELRRWVPGRAAVLAGVSVVVLLVANLVGRSAVGKPGEDLTVGVWLAYAFIGWTAIVVVVTIAVGQSLLADDVESGTAAWVVSLPVARRAYVLAKFLATAPVVALAAVLVPGMLAYPLFASVDATVNEFSALDVVEAVGEDPALYEGMPSLGTYIGQLALIALLAVFLLAVMLLLGTRLVSNTALLALGLLAAGVLVIVTQAGLTATPGAAFLAVWPDGLDDLSLGSTVAASALWTVVVVGLAMWSFQRRAL
jgi:hypothetical protein